MGAEHLLRSLAMKRERESLEAGLPLHLSAINGAQYIVWRYSLVRSGIQKALLQQACGRSIVSFAIRRSIKP